MQVFRDQLSSLERDVESGVLTAAEAAGARAEISRRLLAAGAEAERGVGASPAPKAVSRIGAAALVALVVVGGGGLYAMLGVPGAPDRPLAVRLAEMRDAAEQRPTQEEAERFVAENMPPVAEAEPNEGKDRARALIDQLREVLKDRPDDVRGHRLLAGSLMRTGDYVGARKAQRKVLYLLGDSATADDYLTGAEMMILAAGGYVSPEAEDLLRMGLLLDPAHPQGRYYAGLVLLQTGRAQLAMNMWRQLLEDAPQDAPWRAAVASQIEALSRDMADAGGAPGAAAPGPDAADVKAAAEMSETDRAALIESMVARLEDRLATEGGAPEEWERLIRAYGVLGRAEDAARILADAERAYAETPDVLARLRRVAAEAGVGGAGSAEPAGANDG